MQARTWESRKREFVMFNPPPYPDGTCGSYKVSIAYLAHAATNATLVSLSENIRPGGRYLARVVFNVSPVPPDTWTNNILPGIQQALAATRRNVNTRTDLDGLVGHIALGQATFEGTPHGTMVTQSSLYLSFASKDVPGFGTGIKLGSIGKFIEAVAREFQKNTEPLGLYSQFNFDPAKGNVEVWELVIGEIITSEEFKREAPPLKELWEKLPEESKEFLQQPLTRVILIAALVLFIILLLSR